MTMVPSLTIPGLSRVRTPEGWSQVVALGWLENVEAEPGAQMGGPSKTLAHIGHRSGAILCTKHFRSQSIHSFMFPLSSPRELLPGISS